MMSLLGCSPDELGGVLKALGFRLDRRPIKPDAAVPAHRQRRLLPQSAKLRRETPSGRGRRAGSLSRWLSCAEPPADAAPVAAEAVAASRRRCGREPRK